MEERTSTSWEAKFESGVEQIRVLAQGIELLAEGTVTQEIRDDVENHERGVQDAYAELKELVMANGVPEGYLGRLDSARITFDGAYREFQKTAQGVQEAEQLGATIFEEGLARIVEATANTLQAAGEIETRIENGESPTADFYNMMRGKTDLEEAIFDGEYNRLLPVVRRMEEPTARVLLNESRTKFKDASGEFWKAYNNRPWL